ncbi:hypothetical protein ACRAWB_18315 [Leifsonia poae]|uniref:hypothetical protein n=1 Tax=Leifsonia poae TaxID=110933 RepID=UPI003D682BD5
MDDYHVWLRIIGTLMQIGGLAFAFLDLLKKHRLYSEDHSGLIESGMREALDKTSATLMRLWRAIRREPAPAPTQYGPSQIGYVTFTMPDGPVNDRAVDASSSVADQIDTLVGYARDDLDEIRRLRRQGETVEEAVKSALDDIEAARRAMDKTAENHVATFALNGLRPAAWGLLVTALGTALAALG